MVEDTKNNIVDKYNEFDMPTIHSLYYRSTKYFHIIQSFKRQTGQLPV